MSETVKCPTCGKERPAGVKLCEDCCRLCGKEIPHKAARCNVCSAYQRGWRRGLPLPATVGMLAPTAALLTAIVTFFPFACTQWTNFEHRHSQTAIGFAGADGNAVYAHVWNTGLRPSAVKTYRLKLANVYLQDVPLVPIRDATHEVRSLIPPGGDVPFVLQVLGLETLPGKTRADVLNALYENKEVTLEADVTESNGATRRSEPIGAVLLRPVVLNKLPP